MEKALSSKPHLIKVTAFVLLFIMFAAVSAAYFIFFRQVTVYVGDDVYRRITMSRTVQEVLDEIGLELREEDYVYPGRDESLSRRAGIVIIEAQPYVVSHDGQALEIWSVGKKVADILQDAGVSWAKQDIVLPPLESPVTNAENIAVVRVESEVFEEEEIVPYPTQRRPTQALYRGQERQIQTGRDGKIVRTIEVTYHDGEEVERKLLDQSTVVEVRPRVIEYGAVSTITSRSGGHQVNFRSVVNVLATAYCPGTPGTECPIDERGWSACTGPYNTVWSDGYNRTSTGMRAKMGSGTPDDPHIIAVDPRVIPLGSMVYMRFSGGRVVTRHGEIITDGFAIAADVGSAIKGNRIDILFDNHWVAWYFGHKQVQVFIVDNIE